MRVVTTTNIGPHHVEHFKKRFPKVEFNVYNNIEEAMKSLPEAEILITFGEDLTADIINQATNLRWIQVISAGVELLPFAALQEKNIVVTNARGIHAIPMAEYTIGAILQHVRRFLPIRDNQRAKVWDRMIRTEEAFEKALGVVGTGAIGSEIARRAKAFGMKTLGLNRDGHPVEGFDQVYPRDELHALLAASDFIVVIVPLTEKTRHMIGAAEFAVMKPTALFINVARGPVVDEQALIDALRAEKIAGAVLDVFEQEPLPPESPLWTLPNVFITPHQSAKSPRYMERALRIFERNLQRYIQGDTEWENRVCLNRGY